MPNSERIAELRAELAALETESSENVEEVLDEAAATIEEAIVEATDEAAEQIEAETGEVVTPDEREILAGMVATAVAEKLAPYLNPIVPPQSEEVADAIVEEAPEPDTAPVRTHWSEKRVF